jgi:hypothetical protein
MNARQLLEVATKVFVNQDQEAKREADRKMKRKVDFLAVDLSKQSGGPQHAGRGRGRGNPCGRQSVPLEQPHPREELRQDQCAYCHQEGHGKNECPQWPRDPQKAPQTRGRGQVIEGKYQPDQGRSSSWEEEFIGLATFEDYKED